MRLLGVVWSVGVVGAKKPPNSSSSRVEVEKNASNFVFFESAAISQLQQQNVSSSLSPTSMSPSPVVGATCPLPSVPRKALSACVLANGRCVASRAECESSGGTYDVDGCGGGRLYLTPAQREEGPASCACCTELPTFAPTIEPTESLAPSFPYPRGTCEIESVPRAALVACVKTNGYCISSRAECDEIGGDFDARGCDATARCGCCARVPTDPPEPEPTRSPIVETTTPTPTRSPFGGDESPEPRLEHASRPTGYFGLASLVVVLAIAAIFFPAPSNPIARAVFSPFSLALALLKAALVFVASFCFTFGDGISEPRPPAPIGMKAIPLREIPNADQRRRADCNTTEALLNDAELEDYEFETDDDDEDSGDNPFKKRT